MPQATPSSEATTTGVPSSSIRYTVPSKRLETWRRPSASKASDVGLGMPLMKGSREPSRRTLKIETGESLATRAAERHVKVAVLVEGRIVDLVKPGGERGADLDVRGLAGSCVDADRGPSAVKARRHSDIERVR